MLMDTLEKTNVEDFMQDGCDSCGPHVRATHIATLGAMMITLCNHHANLHEPGLAAQGWVLEALTSES